MFKWQLFAFIWVFLFQASEAALPARFETRRLPDFALAPEPVAIGGDQAAMAFFQVGPKTFRASGTYGVVVADDQFLKCTAEYLNQKLGFQFQSGRIHRWVQQGAFGVSYLCPVNLFGFEDLDLGVTTSVSKGRNFGSFLAPEQNLITERRIAGANAYGMNVKALASFWPCSSVTFKGFYDWVHYRRHLKRKKDLQGLGIGVAFSQSFYNSWNILLEAEIREPYFYYSVRLFSTFFSFGRTGEMTLFADKTVGRQQLPSSSRIGIEFGFAFGSCRGRLEGEASPPGPFMAWMAQPAVKSAEVLVIKDQLVTTFGGTVSAISTIGVIHASLGNFSFDAAPYFSSTSKLIYGAKNLPPGLAINPLTGMITGIVDGSVHGPFLGAVTAANYFGFATQPLEIVLP